MESLNNYIVERIRIDNIKSTYTGFVEIPGYINFRWISHLYDDDEIRCNGWLVTGKDNRLLFVSPNSKYMFIYWSISKFANYWKVLSETHNVDPNVVGHEFSDDLEKFIATYEDIPVVDHMYYPKEIGKILHDWNNGKLRF